MFDWILQQQHQQQQKPINNFSTCYAIFERTCIQFVDFFSLLISGIALFRSKDSAGGSQQKRRQKNPSQQYRRFDVLIWCDLLIEFCFHCEIGAGAFILHSFYYIVSLRESQNTKHSWKWRPVFTWNANGVNRVVFESRAAQSQKPNSYKDDNNSSKRYSNSSNNKQKTKKKKEVKKNQPKLYQKPDEA